MAVDANTFGLGDQVRVWGEWTVTEDNTPIDPTNVYITVRTPSGKIKTYQYNTDVAVVKDSTGNYYYDINADIPGWWHYRWWSDGVGKAGQERKFYVEPAQAIK